MGALAVLAFGQKAVDSIARPLLPSMQKVGKLEEFGVEWFEEILGYCNRMVRCGFVLQGLVCGCINVVHTLLDRSQYLVQLKVGGRV